MAKRGSEAISVTPTGHQSFHDRYKRRRYHDETPRIAQWRCNLTGLSQVHNLYFIAYGPDVYVYIPQFPTQAIAEEPTLIFTSQPSAPRLRGHLDPRNPHAINNLVVQLLGNEEVVAVVRDDGDVDAFLVRHIFQAIARRAEAGNVMGVVADEIRPFFQSNVGNSAWGLAIHADARILATSSNAHEVRVFKFGLLQTEEGSSDDEDDELLDADLSDTNHGKDRKTDVTHHILNGESNIPYISFCNTGDDPEGRWLLTTDISGVCRVMDLRHFKHHHAFRFNKSYATPDSDNFDRYNAGWLLMFLDRQSFQEERSIQDALGLAEGEILPEIKRNPYIWDISKTVQRLPEHSEAFVYVRPKRGERWHRRRSHNNETDDAVDSSMLDQQEETSVDDDSSSDGGAQLEVEVEVHETSSEVGDGFAQTETIEPDVDQDNEAQVSVSVENHDDESISSSFTDDESVQAIDDGDDPEDEMDEHSTPYTSDDTICYHQPQFFVTEDTTGEQLPCCPILHASVRNIYLLQPSNDTKVTNWSSLMIGLANPLRQAIQQDFEYLRIFERLNMSAHIPALGVVVVASQKGRAIVMGLTKLRSSAHYPPEMLGANGDLPPWKKKTHYAMRVECIIPFTQQEKAHERPFAPLHGIAASPLQGYEGQEGGGRWKLMMMYQDHSILSYEISRRVSDGGESVGVESVVV